MKPIYFVPAYLALAVLTTGLPMEEPESTYLALAGFIGTLALHLMWIRQAENSLSEKLAPAQSHLPRKFYKYHNAVGIIAGLLIIAGLFLKGSSVLEETPIKEMLLFAFKILAVVWWVFFVLMLWVAAQSLCFAEGNAKAKVNSVVGAVFLFFYIPIGAPFIYARLKKIQGVYTAELAPD